MMFELRRPASPNSIYFIVFMSMVIGGFVKSDADDRCINPVNVFLEEPGPMEQYAPINTNITHVCSVDNVNINWTIRVVGQTFGYNTGVPYERDILRSRGIFAEPLTNSGSTRSSRLTVTASEENNGTLISCITIFTDQVVRCGSTEVTLLVYDRPSSPSGLMVETVDVQVVNISWTISTPNIPGSDLASTLMVINLNASTSSTLVYEGLTQLHYIFNATVHQSVSPCDHYQFTVTATNRAGVSNAEEVTTTLPSLPEISSVSDSLVHVVEKNVEGRIVIQVTFLPAGFCEEYPVTNYSVVLKSSRGIEIKTYPMMASAGERLEATFGPSDNVQENTMYLYSVTAVNSEGNITSISKECYTSDLKRLNFTRKGNRTLSFQCHFINGTDAVGCKIVLVSNNNHMENFSSTFYRINSELILHGEVNVSEDLSCYHGVFGFDVESDNSTSDLALPGDFNITSQSDCSPRTKDVNAASLPPEGAIIGAVLAAITVCVAICAIVFIIVMVIVSKRDNRKVNSKQSTFERYEDSPSSLNKADNIDRQETQETIVLPVYDQPEKIKAPESSVFLGSSSPKEYDKLTRGESHHSHMTSPAQQVDTSGVVAEYAQLDETLPVYAVLENNKQVPIYAEPSTITHQEALNVIPADPNAPPLPAPPLYNEIGSEEQPSSSGRVSNWPYSSSTNPPSSGTDVL